MAASNKPLFWPRAFKTILNSSDFEDAGISRPEEINYRTVAGPEIIILFESLAWNHLQQPKALWHQFLVGFDPTPDGTGA